MGGEGGRWFRTGAGGGRRIQLGRAGAGADGNNYNNDSGFFIEKFLGLVRFGFLLFLFSNYKQNHSNINSFR